MAFLLEFWRFLRVRKKYWLLPVLLMMVVVFGGLIVLTQGSAVAPFIYMSYRGKAADLFSPALDQFARSEARPSRPVLQERCGLTDLALTPNSWDPSTTDMAGLLMVEKELQMELESAVGELARNLMWFAPSRKHRYYPRPAPSEGQRLIALAPVQEATCTAPTFLARLQCWFEADEPLP
jgi:Family of unknown function (DUF5989)